MILLQIIFISISESGCFISSFSAKTIWNNFFWLLFFIVWGFFDSFFLLHKLQLLMVYAENRNSSEICLPLEIWLPMPDRTTQNKRRRKGFGTVA